MSYPLPGLVVDPQGVSTSVTVTDGTGATATVYSDRYGLSPVSNPQTIVARTTVYVPGSGRWTVTANSVAYAVTLEGAEVGSVTIAQSGSGANVVPVGGTTSQALVKNSNTDYDTKWSTVGGALSTVPAWATGQPYALGAEVLTPAGGFTSGVVSYARCSSAHTSAGTFAADAASWEQIADILPGVPVSLGNTTPSAPSTTGGAGSATTALRSDAVIPLGVLGRAMTFSGLPPGMNNTYGDFVLDGVWNGFLSGNHSYGYFAAGAYNIFNLAGSIYTMAQSQSVYSGFMCRNFTLNTGITLKPNASGGGVIIVASQAITINGTIDCSGASASGATGGAGGSTGGSSYRGYAGATGGTGVGAQGSYWGGSQFQPAGGGGAGGASGGGTNAGGGARPGGAGTIFPGMENLAYMRGTINAYNSFTLPGGGHGGSAGGGDGANAGGGGAAGGGFVILIAPTITIGAAAILNAQGGIGATGVAGNAGGGGGGGGGCVGIHALSLTITAGAAISVLGGAGGAGAGTGSAGSHGTPTSVTDFQALFYDPAVGAGGYGFGAGCLICQWQ